MSLITILYEDENVLVVNKPAGLVVHADGRTDEITLVDWILQNYPEMKDVGEPLIVKNELRIKNQELGQEQEKGNSVLASTPNPIIYRPGIVHRIDRDTSGVLVIAKNQKTFEFLKSQFQEREVEKVYQALVYGVVKGDDGVIDRPITRSRKDFRLWSAQRGGRGVEREAVTEYKVLKRITATKGGGENGFSLLELRPKTGRTHQIRVHLKAINHPVVCDTLYAPKRECAFGFSRLALHALSIEFTLPTGKKLKVEAPLPDDFKNAVAGLDIEKEN